MGNPEIKNRWSGSIIIKANKYTSIKIAVENNKADLWEADLRGANLREADLRGANLRKADLRGANLRKADLRGANLREADLWGANLWGADLRGANLREADLWEADLWEANLREADLREADLWGANLREADLWGANLREADLRKANLWEADLREADLWGVEGINPYICTPLLMLYDQPGKIRAYKLVNAKNEGPYQGGIVYKKGEIYEVKEFNTDPNIQCAEGINLATLDWCIMNWQKGYKILIAEFTKEDIVCIPTATDGKFRVKKCIIVGRKTLKELGLRS